MVTTRRRPETRRRQRREPEKSRSTERVAAGRDDTKLFDRRDGSGGAGGTRRPLAVMISNDKAAMPHYGMNNAGVIYEAPVEGGINRYMAIIEDYDDLERIGSVRSCRTYYTYFAKEFEAVYAHFGQSVFALPYLENVDNINGIEGLGGRAFYRTER